MKDLRSFIQAWRERCPEETVVIRDEISHQYEIAAIVKKFDLAGKHPLLIFEKVKGFDIPVVCNVEATNKHLGLALGTEPDRVFWWYNQVEEEVMAGKRNFPPVEVDPSSAPVKEVILRGEEVDLFSFPFPIHHQGESPYATRGIGITRDPVTGHLHAAHYRLMMKDKRLMVTHITPGRHLWYIYKKAEALGQNLPIAFAIGSHPAVSLGSQSRIAHPPTEYDVIGGLLGESLEVVRCETSDLLVPARAEMVIEGELRPGLREMEGPWSDFTRYSQVAPRHPVFVSAVTHRRDMLLHDAGSWLSVGHAIARIPQQAYVRREVMKAVPAVKDFRFGLFPQPMYGLISIEKTHEAEPKQAILAAFAAELYLKWVIALDTDIDLNNSSEIFWAVATRAQADRDFLVLPGVLGLDLDLSAPKESVLTKVGIDATAKPFRKDLPPVGKIPEEVLARIDIGKFL